MPKQAHGIGKVDDLSAAVAAGIRPINLHNLMLMLLQCAKLSAIATVSLVSKANNRLV